MIALRWARRSSSGFTLIELVMVVSVIAVLAGILLPVLRCARSQAEKIQCVSNLHQLGRAFGLYLSDWNGVYPAPGGKPGDYNYWSQSGSGGIVSYVGSNGGVGTVWCCPKLTEWHGRYPARTYSMNSYLRDPPDIGYPTCISIFKGCPDGNIEDPRRTILLYEGQPLTYDWPDIPEYNYIYRCGNWECVRGWYPKDNPRRYTMNSWKPWHGDKNNYLYCDGHIRSFKPNKWPNRPPYDATNEWWVRKTEMAIRYKGW